MSKKLLCGLLTLLIITSFVSAFVAPAVQNPVVTQDENNPVADTENLLYGDANGDGVIDQLDIDFLIAYIFDNGDAPSPLLLGDADESGTINIADVVFLINLLKLEEPEDALGPEIELLNPEDGYSIKTSKDSKEIDFEFIVSDESDIAVCKLIIDGDVEKEKTNVEKDVLQIFSLDLDRGTYYWRIACEDVHGNNAESEVRELKITKKETTQIYNEPAPQPNNEDNDFSFVYEQEEVIFLGAGNEKPFLGLEFDLHIFLFIILTILILFMLVLIIIFSRD